MTTARHVECLVTIATSRGKKLTQLYPLRFEPIFRRIIWGGRRLQTVLGKSLGEGDDFAESWEVVDHGHDQSVVTAGSLAGCALHQLVMEHGKQLFGRHHPQTQFPLLFKFLDANNILSLQVHPNDEQARRLDPPDLGKSEAWVVLDTNPGCRIFAGLKPGVGRQQLEEHVRAGTCESLLHQFEPRVGDCVLLQAGTVHAIGAGLLIAEIQQASDTTYRLFDWNRPGADGKPRPLQIEESLATIDFDRGPVNPTTPASTNIEGIQRLCACDKFVLDRWEFATQLECGGDNRFHLLAVLEGSVTIDGEPNAKPLPKGDTALLPAGCGALALKPQGRAVLLDMYLP